MSNVLNNLFDDFGEFFGGKKKTLEQQIEQALKGKPVSRLKFEKDGITTIKEYYTDKEVTYYSEKSFAKENKQIIQNENENIQNLTKQLNEAIAREEYEVAAELRDKITKLKNRK